MPSTLSSRLDSPRVAREKSNWSQTVQETAGQDRTAGKTAGQDRTAGQDKIGLQERTSEQDRNAGKDCRTGLQERATGKDRTAGQDSRTDVQSHTSLLSISPQLSLITERKQMQVLCTSLSLQV